MSYLKSHVRDLRMRQTQTHPFRGVKIHGVKVGGTLPLFLSWRTLYKTPRIHYSRVETMYERDTVNGSIYEVDRIDRESCYVIPSVKTERKVVYLFTFMRQISVCQSFVKTKTQKLVIRCNGGTHSLYSS